MRLLYFYAHSIFHPKYGFMGKCTPTTPGINLQIILHNNFLVIFFMLENMKDSLLKNLLFNMFLVQKFCLQDDIFSEDIK